MKIGLSLPNNWGLDDPLDLVELAVLADDAGFASVWVSEHILNISYVEKRIGNRPYYHPLALLAFIAARTPRIALGTSVLVLPFHHPAELAKFTATLDCLSPGRLILGVGVGAVPEEFAALGLAFNQRGKVTSESLEVIRALWTQERAAHHGSLWDFEGITFSPKPRNAGGIPLWVGGGTSPSVLRRAALLGDGWHATGMSREEFSAGVETVRRMAGEGGKDPSKLIMSMRVNVDYGQPLPSAAEAQTLIPSADLQHMTQELAAWGRAGAEHVVLALNVGNPLQLKGEIARIGNGVLRQLQPS
jgi:probable F420-dependent oxidoreductase